MKKYLVTIYEYETTIEMIESSHKKAIKGALSIYTGNPKDIKKVTSKLLRKV